MATQSSAAIRMQRWRSRQAVGEVVLQIVINENQLAAALLDEGASEAEARDPAYLQRAVERIVALWAKSRRDA